MKWWRISKIYFMSFCPSFSFYLYIFSFYLYFKCQNSQIKNFHPHFIMNNVKKMSKHLPKTNLYFVEINQSQSIRRRSSHKIKTFTISLCIKKIKDFDIYWNMENLKKLKREEILSLQNYLRYRTFGYAIEGQSKDKLISKNLV